MIGTDPAGGGETTSGNQLVVIDSKAANAKIHPCPEGRPGRAIPGGNVIGAYPSGGGEVASGNQLVFINTEG